MDKLNRKKTMRYIKKAVTESGLFSEKGINTFITMLSGMDDMIDIDLAKMFALRDGMKTHSFEVVNGFLNRLPLNGLEVCD